MEETRTTTTQDDLLTQWWQDASFDGKQFVSLKEQGALTLNATPFSNERVVATLKPENAEIAVKALVDKFAEVQQKVQELQQEWDAAPDKMKVHSKVARLKDYLLHTPAVGDFGALLGLLNEWDEELTRMTNALYQAKLAIVEEAERIGRESSQWKEGAQTLKDLGEKWKGIGYADKKLHDDLWERMEKARDLFFDRKRAAQEEQEKELMRNLDIKMELVEKAEQLAASEKWRESTDAFKNLQETWKKTGRAGGDKNEQLWHRFQEAQNVFFNRKRIHAEKISKEHEENYAKKLALVEQVEALKESKDYNQTTVLIHKLNDEWRAIGKTPPEKGDDLWNRFKEAQNYFFSHRRVHLENLKVTLEDNYAQKLALVNRAEALKNSTIWREASEEMSELFEEWKKIGPVPKNMGDILWERFIAARKHFFARKDESRERRKLHIEKAEQQRLQNTQDFYRKVQQELADEKERLADLKEALTNVTKGPKEKELRAHLTNLIADSEIKIKNKITKVEEAKKIAEAAMQRARKASKAAKEAPAAKEAETPAEPETPVVEEAPPVQEPTADQEPAI